MMKVTTKIEIALILIMVLVIMLLADLASAQSYVDVERENYEAAARAEQAALDARNYTPSSTPSSATATTSSRRRADPVGDFLGEGRNFALEEVRISFVEALSPGISEGALSPALLFTKEKWNCSRHLAFTSVDFDGASGVDRRTLSFEVERGRIQDSDGFRYSYRNGVEMVGNTRDTKFIRSLRYEYYCDDFPFCDEDNYTGLNLVIEESMMGEGLLSYLSRYLNGVSGKDAVAALIRTSGLAALNRRTWGCEPGKWLTGCEIAVNYYQCWDGE